MTKIYFPLIAILTLMLIVIYFIARNNLRRQSRGVKVQAYYTAMSNLSNYFSGKISKFHRFFLSQPSFKGEFSGYRFSLTFWRSEVIGVPPTALILTCRITSKSKLKIFMYSKDPGTVLFAQRVYTGDDDLDKYFIYSNRPEEAKRYFLNVSRRGALKYIVQKGWAPPHITGNKIKTEIAIRQPELNPEIIKETLKMMIALQN